MKKTAAPTLRKKNLLSGWSLLPLSFNLTKEHLTNVLYLVVLPNLYLTLGQVYTGMTDNRSSDYRALSLFLVITGILWLLINQAPTVLFAVRAAQGKSLTLTECYRQGLPFFWRYIALEILLFGIVVIGLILLIIPGLIALFLILKRYYLAPYFMIDQNLGIKATLAKCREQTEPYFTKILEVILVQMILVIAAAIVGVLGILVGTAASTAVAAITVFLLALRYQEITAKLPRKVFA